MTELELLKFQLNMANDTIRNLERIKENVLNKNDILNKKLKIAINSLNDIATFDNYIVAQLDAQQALQKIEEVK